MTYTKITLLIKPVLKIVQPAFSYARVCPPIINRLITLVESD